MRHGQHTIFKRRRRVIPADRLSAASAALQQIEKMEIAREQLSKKSAHQVGSDAAAGFCMPPPSVSMGAGDTQSTANSVLHPFAAPQSCASPHRGPRSRLPHRGSWAVVSPVGSKLRICIDDWGGPPLIDILYRKPSSLPYAVRTTPWDPGGCTCELITCPPSVEEAAKIKSENLFQIENNK
jgi:hypothetical protein